jgi:predicted nucleic acid-binding Zn ribbon protein
MPTYLYETLPGEGAVERFELRQRFDEPALDAHPVTGVPVRRVISGGLALMTKGSDASLPDPGPGCGPANCHCGRFD